MDQLKEEIQKYKPEYTNKIQTIGDSRNKFNQNKDITICVYNSVNILESYFDLFDRIYIDEAHNIYKPEIYSIMDDSDIIQKLKRYNNNIYLSATIDEIDGFLYYKKDLRDMIEKGYLCDYNIHVPIFTDNPDDKKTCEHIINTYRNVILYCKNRNEGKNIYKMMNHVQIGCCQYIYFYKS